jgi:hypothetical protein
MAITISALIIFVCAGLLVYWVASIGPMLLTTWKYAGGRAHAIPTSAERVTL